LHGVVRYFFLHPLTLLLHVPDNGLTTLMYMHVLHGDLLLALAAMAVQSFKQGDEERNASSAEILAPVSGLEIAGSRIEVGAVNLPTILIPSRHPRRRPISGGRVVRTRRRWRWIHVDGSRRQRAAYNGADSKTKQSGTNRISVTSVCHRWDGHSEE
jgi:hypothetical protein